MNNSIVVQAIGYAIVALLAAAISTSVRSEANQPAVASYVLSLSWSPTYCESNPQRADQRQCSSRRPYAFILHGLWPQWARGWPEFCPTRHGKYVPERIVRSMLDIMPARGLVIHQYRKHGTCSGLSPAAYFDHARDLYEAIRIPERFTDPQTHIYTTANQIRDEFAAANPSLEPDMIAVACGRRGRLRDVRICFSGDFEPAPCGIHVNRKGLCRMPRIALPPVRGGS